MTTPLIIAQPEIEEAVAQDGQALMEALSDGFVAFSKGKVQVADVGHLSFGHLGSACVKSGGIAGSGRWVVKVASTFHENAPALSNSQGAMLVFCESTGELKAVLLDNGRLTDLRTALAAVLCAREFGPDDAKTFVIVGSGTIGRLVAKLLRTLHIAPLGSSLCIVSTKLSRSSEAAEVFWNDVDPERRHWHKEIIKQSTEQQGIIEECADIIFTCTPSTQALLFKCKPGALVVALGADSSSKRQLGQAVFQRSPGQTLVVLADSKAQCRKDGELHHALAEGMIDEADVRELGEALDSPPGQRVRAGSTVTVIVDLTGVAVQDAVISSRVLDAVLASRAAAELQLPSGAGHRPQGTAACDTVPRQGATAAQVAAVGRAMGAADEPAALPLPKNDAGAAALTGAKRKRPAAGAHVPDEEPEAQPLDGHVADRHPARESLDPALRPQSSGVRAAASRDLRSGRAEAMASAHVARVGSVRPEARSGPNSPSRSEQEAAVGAQPEPPWSPERVKQCLNLRLQVYWENEKKWFAGTATKLNGKEDMVFVLYDDGDRRWYSIDETERSGKPSLKWHELRLRWIDPLPAELTAEVSE